MKKSLFAAVTILSALTLFADGELDINGKFQPKPGSKSSVPRLWYSQHVEYKTEADKVRISLSEPDEKGVRTLEVVTSPDFRKDTKGWRNFCIFTADTKILQTAAGDEYSVSAEIAGEGKMRFGFLGYGTPAYTQVVNLTKEFRTNSFEFKTKSVKDPTPGKAFYRLYFEFFPGSSIKIRNVKLFKKSAPAKAEENAK
ncbi:MAG: hypothetical protein J6331_08845 [Lentisphaeria bacterium]|nr:hypothetical protein [Lentisphaeria bacterium]